VTHLDSYAKAPNKSAKGRIVTAVIKHIQKDSPSETGFVKYDEKRGRWMQVAPLVVREKVCQRFREALTQQDPIKKIQDRKKRQMRKERHKNRELEVDVATTMTTMMTTPSHGSTTATTTTDGTTSGVKTNTTTTRSTSGSNHANQCDSKVTMFPIEDFRASLGIFDDQNHWLGPPTVTPIKEASTIDVAPVLLERGISCSSDLHDLLLLSPTPIQSMEVQTTPVVNVNFLSECVSITDDSSKDDEDEDASSSISTALWEFNGLSPPHSPP
jgi:hypothetical protein